MKLLEALTKFDAKSWALRLDSWVNTVTGFGTSKDKSTYGEIAPSRRLSDIELSALYHGDDMAARMVDIVPQEILREGFGVTTGSQDLDAALKTKNDKLNVREKLTDTIRWARLYGGAALLLGADDGRDSTLPLIPERAESLNYLHVIDRRLLWPVDYYLDATHPKFGQPKTYSVMSVGGPASYTATVHESRLVIFRGAPTGIYERAQWGSWDLSVLQRPYEILRQFNTGWKAVELMLTDGNQAVLKMSGLTELIASNDLTLLRNRIEANELYRSVVRALVVDADSNESFERQGVSFSDIPATLEKFMLRLSAAVQIPVTILMGQSPAGMSATGDSDFRWFYDRIRSQQTTELEPRIRRIIDVMLATREFASEGFKRPEHVELTFPPLWKLTPLEEAQRRLVIAQTDTANIQSQVVTPEEVALSRFTPRGFGEEITITDEARKARERVLIEDLESMNGGTSDTDSDGETDASTSAAPAASIELAPTDLASIVKVNEARRTQRLPPIPDGDMTIEEYRNRSKAVGGDVGSDSGEASPRTDANVSRLFELHRDEDETGVSGTGVIADGAVFTDGTVALRWRTKTASTTLFDNIDEVARVHGHGGKTRIVFLDETRTDGDEFKESDHPRASDGKFGSGGSSGGPANAKPKDGDGAKGGAKAPPAKVDKATAIAHAADVVEKTATKAEPADFHSKFSEAMKDNPFRAFVTHYTPEELSNMKALVTVAGGKAGIAVKDHGDGRIEGTALFNNGGPPFVGTELLRHAIKEHGVNYVECFGEDLRHKYESLGFKVATTDSFSDEHAPKDWDHARHGRPKYYTLRTGNE